MLSISSTSKQVDRGEEHTVKSDIIILRLQYKQCQSYPSAPDLIGRRDKT
jgi:hypothetical protein